MADTLSASAAANNKKRVTVLFSGRGTNMASLIKAGMAKDYPALVTRAITNVPDAKGRDVAERHDIPCDIVDHREFDTREDAERFAEYGGFAEMIEPFLIAHGYSDPETRAELTARTRVVNVLVEYLDWAAQQDLFRSDEQETREAA